MTQLCSKCEEKMLFTVPEKFVCDDCVKKERDKWKNGIRVGYSINLELDEVETFDSEDIIELLDLNGTPDREKVRELLKRDLSLLDFNIRNTDLNVYLNYIKPLDM